MMNMTYKSCLFVGTNKAATADEAADRVINSKWISVDYDPDPEMEGESVPTLCPMPMSVAKEAARARALSGSVIVIPVISDEDVEFSSVHARTNSPSAVVSARAGEPMSEIPFWGFIDEEREYIHSIHVGHVTPPPTKVVRSTPSTRRKFRIIEDPSHEVYSTLAAAEDAARGFAVLSPAGGAHIESVVVSADDDPVVSTVVVDEDAVVAGVVDVTLTVGRAAPCARPIGFMVGAFTDCDLENG